MSFEIQSMVGLRGYRSSSTMISRRSTSQAQLGMDASNFCRLDRRSVTIVHFIKQQWLEYSSSFADYINLIQSFHDTCADLYNTNSMEKITEWIELTEENEDDLEVPELKKYESQQLIRMSQILHKNLDSFHKNSELNFQEALHLEVQVEKVRDLIFQCNLELTDFIVSHMKDNHREGRLSQKKAKLQEQSNEGTVSFLKKDDQWLEHIKYTLQSFKKTLTLRQVQLTMVLFVAEHNGIQNFEEIYIKNYGMLSPFIIPPKQTSKPLNLAILEDLLKKQTEYLQNYHSELQNLNRVSSLAERQDLQFTVAKMKISHSKIKTIGEIFPWACIKEKNDLFSESPCSLRWQMLTGTGQIKYLSLGTRQDLVNSFENIRNNITVVNAAMSVLDRHRGSSEESLSKQMGKILKTAAEILKVAIFKSKAHHEASVMIAEPEETLTKQIWNLPENKKFKDFVEMSLPYINFSQVLYLPRKLKNYFFSRYHCKEETPFPYLHIDNLEQYWQQLKKKQSYDETIRVRINCPFALLQRTEGTNKNQGGLLAGWSKLFQKEYKVPKQIIFHIHGGGFISMSSFIHQIYIRQWASSLKVPIISVDYGKAPDRPFPQGLYDCVQAYIWVLTAFKKTYQVQPQKIIMIGDSAGGNLCAALVTLLLKWNLPAPSGLVLVYPALNLNFQDYTPSLLTALNDMILPHTFLKLCLKAYLKEPTLQPEKDPFISPILTPKDIWSQYPPTEVLVGNKDPFHDDCCRLVEKMNWAKQGNCKLTIFQEFPHGFLQFDSKLFPNEYSREATKIVQKCIAKLLAM